MKKKHLFIVIFSLWAIGLRAAPISLMNTSFETPALSDGGSVVLAISNSSEFLTGHGPVGEWVARQHGNCCSGYGDISITNPLNDSFFVPNGENIAVFETGSSLHQTFVAPSFGNADYLFSGSAALGGSIDWGIYVSWVQDSTWRYLRLISAGSVSLPSDELDYFDFLVPVPGDLSTDDGLMTLNIINFSASGIDLLVDDISLGYEIPLPGGLVLFLTAVSSLVAAARFRRTN